MKTMSYSLHLFRLYLILISCLGRVFHQSGFLCIGFLQLVIILIPLVFPDWVNPFYNILIQIKGFYSW